MAADGPSRGGRPRKPLPSEQREAASFDEGRETLVTVAELEKWKEGKWSPVEYLDHVRLWSNDCEVSAAPEASEVGIPYSLDGGEGSLLPLPTSHKYDKALKDEHSCVDTDAVPTKFCVTMPKAIAAAKKTAKVNVDAIGVPTHSSEKMPKAVAATKKKAKASMPKTQVDVCQRCSLHLASGHGARAFTNKSRKASAKDFCKRKWMPLGPFRAVRFPWSYSAGHGVCIDLLGGTGSWGTAMRKQGFQVDIYDAIIDSSMDMFNPLFREFLLRRVCAGMVFWLQVAVACGTFSIACKPALRIPGFMLERPDLPPHKIDKVHRGNTLAAICLQVIYAQILHGGWVSCENLAWSYLWKLLGYGAWGESCFSHDVIFDGLSVWGPRGRRAHVSVPMLRGSQPLAAAVRVGILILLCPGPYSMEVGGNLPLA